MSRIIILEVPDKYKLTGRDLLFYIHKTYPEIELKLSANFDWWKNMCSNLSLENILPLMPSKKMIDNVDEYITMRRYPKSIEEREAKK